MNENEMRAKMESIQSSIDVGSSQFKDLWVNSQKAYSNRWKTPMPEGKLLVLKNSIVNVTNLLKNKGVSAQQILSATQDISKVDNPITLLYNMLSLLIPNFAYTEVVGVQPQITREAPIFYPQLSAFDTRNGVAAGTQLLGAANWASSNSYTGNRNVETKALAAGTAQSVTTAYQPLIPGTVSLKITIAGVGTKVVTDDGQGNLGLASGYITAGTVVYSTGVIAWTSATALITDSCVYSYRYDLNAYDPAKAVFEFSSKPAIAYPRRLRSSYSLDNLYEVKQVLKDYNLDKIMTTTIAGYLNKEISGSVFDEILDDADADYSWDSTPDTGVAWAFHRLQALQTIIEASNGIRSNINRSAGNKLILGTDWVNLIETLGKDVWEPVSYSDEPIGPYLSGKLLSKFDVIKNQDYPVDTAAMVYKKSEVDASEMVGVHIGLYSTNPIALDDLKVIQGMGTQISRTKVVDNSVVSLTMTASE